MSKLGKLERVADITSVWAGEAQAFTPWLADEKHLSLLSEALGLGPEGLEVIRTEKSFGSFRADIVCRETGPQGRTVVIENQFGVTDHDHLGKLLTYAAGNQAYVLVWIAERIREEHEAALDLINSVSNDNFEAFGVEIELWRIADSPPAPRFNIVAKPNNWVRFTKAQEKKSSSNRKLTETQICQLDYWNAFRAKLELMSPPFNPVSPQPGSWISHGIGKTGVSLNLAQSTRHKWIRVEIYLSGDSAKGYFSLLEHHREQIEADLGSELDWQKLEGKTDARICISRFDTDPMDRADWSSQHEWLVKNAIDFYRVFHPIVRKFDREAGVMLG